jgi:peptidase M41-like protein
VTNFDELRSVAFHEAGHALAAHVFRFPIERVTVVPSDDNLGFIRLVDPNVRHANLMKGIVYVLAGYAAERRLLGIKKVTGTEPDFRKAAEGYEELKQHARVTKRAVPTRKELKVRTDALVLKYRQPIAHLAGRLMVHGTLDGLTAHHILQHAMDRRAGSTRAQSSLSRWWTTALVERLESFL